MPFSMSGYPVLKNFSKYNGHKHLYIASGFGPEGIMQGPGSARSFAAYILNKRDLYKNQDMIQRVLEKEWGFGN
jgi:glycine/D-amino acid oxidase-like deaminating enzyme